jgi:hypothetical protein
VLIAGPWFVFSWIYLGSAVPDTLVIKTEQRPVWGRWGYFNGPDIYTRGYAGRPNVVALTFAPAIAGVVALGGWVLARRGRIGPVGALGAGGVGYYLVLSAIDPGPYHWYYLPPITALATFLAIALGAWLRDARESPARSPLVPTLALAGAGLLACAAGARAVGHGVPWRSPLITTNFASARDYERVGRAVRMRVGQSAVASSGEIGTLAYYCECQIVEVFSHRGYLVPLVERDVDEAAPVVKQALQLNYLWLDRGERPPRIAYRLAYGHGPGAGRDVWNVWSHWTGPGHFSLIAAGPEPRRRPP